ncbi:unnamed protein product [Rhizoctonia solani]|uniref:Uncharacterized protein n=1 Tax=Rhizoctonia solani TaxID=456999 RepID=A0A8H3GMH9_9AGAM|nr:unnamed protein product [Rhizoctonia solani]
MNRTKKYHNPHHYLHETSLRIVSRNDLASDSDEHISRRESNSKTENDPALSKHMSILDELLSPLAANFASVTKSRKRKRDEPLVSTVNENPGAVIRLVSEKPTVVSTSEPVDGQSKTYLSEDTIEEAEERKRRAVQVAVDFEIIRKQSTIPYPNFKEVASQKYNWKSISATTTIAVVQCPKAKKSRPIYPLSKPIQLKTREPRVKQSSVVDVRSSHPVPPKVEREFVPHTFYHSDETVGGKSAGYAWGYRGSFPRPAGITGYLRDNMRNGLDMMVAGREAGTTQAVEAKLKSAKTPRRQS